MSRRVLPLLLATVALVAACGGDDDQAATAAGATEETGGDTPDDPGDDGAATGDTPAPTPAAFDFVLEDLRGGQVEGASYAGSDVVVWFWAPWCSLCNREAGDVAAVADERDDVRFLGMAGLADQEAAAEFVDRHGLGGFAQAYDENGDTWHEFGVRSQASFAFVDDDGTIETVNYTTLGRDEIERRIDELVAE